MTGIGMMEMEMGVKGVKMEIIGILCNVEKVKFVGPGKVWDGERKLVGPEIYGNYTSQFHSPIPLYNSNKANGPKKKRKRREKV